MVTRTERSFIMVKPDGVQRGLIGEIISRFEKKGYKLIAVKMTVPDESTINKHYAEHVNKSFFIGLKDFLMSSPVFAMVWEGPKVVDTGRKILGKTNPLDSEPGTIRGDYGIDVGRNICHASDSVESAEREIQIWFKDSEIIRYPLTLSSWVLE